MNIETKMAFPKEIDLSLKPFLSTQTFGEKFYDAQEAYVPYYCVSVIEAANEVEKIYKTYDATLFNRYTDEFLKTDPIFADHKITNITHLAARCFEFNSKTICRKIDPDKINFYPILDETSSDGTEEPDDIKKIFLDSVNPYIFHSADRKNRLQGRISQYVFANCLDEVKLSYPPPGERNKEKIIWLWCAAKGSSQARLHLALLCKYDNNQLIENSIAQSRRLLSLKPYSAPSPDETMEMEEMYEEEREALQEIDNQLKEIKSYFK